MAHERESSPTPGSEAEWRVRGACELGINPYSNGHESDFRDDVRVVLDDLSKLRVAHEALVEACEAALPHHQGFHSEVGKRLRAALALARGEEPNVKS